MLVASSAAPEILGRLLTQHLKLLKTAAETMGFQSVGSLWIGLAAHKDRGMDARKSKKARRLGRKLVLRARPNSGTDPKQ